MWTIRIERVANGYVATLMSESGMDKIIALGTLRQVATGVAGWVKGLEGSDER